jgi:hypothetical protein
VSARASSKGLGLCDCNFVCIVHGKLQGSNLAMSAKPSWSNPKLIFDAALADLNNDNSKLSNAGSIVLDRARPLRAQTESTRLRRERALNEAAEALAKLWKR